MRAEVARDGHHLPPLVERERRAFLGCGVLARGSRNSLRAQILRPPNHAYYEGTMQPVSTGPARSIDSGARRMADAVAAGCE